jgi:hypothetical protein
VNDDASTSDRDPEDHEPDRPAPPETQRSGRLSEEDRPNHEPEMVGELADEDQDLSAEEAAVRVRRNAPGATSDASDDYPDDSDAG